MILIFQGLTSKRFGFISLGKYNNKIYFIQFPYNADPEPMLRVYN